MTQCHDGPTQAHSRPPGAQAPAVDAVATVPPPIPRTIAKPNLFNERAAVYAGKEETASGMNHGWLSWHGVTTQPKLLEKKHKGTGMQLCGGACAQPVWGPLSSTPASLNRKKVSFKLRRIRELLLNQQCWCWLSKWFDPESRFSIFQMG